MPWRFLHMEAHFEVVKANFIRCEECNENFFFDFLRHPRYFVTHFKSCHLKNLLYRFNGHSEEENMRVRFGPRRKKDANQWFGQLKSTEKRMISMQDNKWSEISERECWSCRLCNDGKADLTQVFELSELGRGQAFLHLRQAHERVYDDFLRRLPTVHSARDLEASTASSSLLTAHTLAPSAPPLHRVRSAPSSSHGRTAAMARGDGGSAETPLDRPLALELARRSSSGDLGPAPGSTESSDVLHVPPHLSLPDDCAPSTRSLQQRMAEAERSRMRRLKASAEVRHVEALRSKKRRENLTPVQRQADYERRKRKKKRLEESERSRKRREQATDESRQRELLRSRERRRNASEDQRRREAERSKRRRENASEAQRLKERERCRKRYELKKSRKRIGGSSGSQYSSAASSGHVSDDDGFGGSESSLAMSEHRPSSGDDDRRQQPATASEGSEYEPPPRHATHFDPSGSDAASAVALAPPFVAATGPPGRALDSSLRYLAASQGPASGHAIAPSLPFSAAGLALYGAPVLATGSSRSSTTTTSALGPDGADTLSLRTLATPRGPSFATTPSVSSPSPLFVLPQLPPALHALAQSLQPVESAASTALSLSAAAASSDFDASRSGLRPEHALSMPLASPLLASTSSSTTTAPISSNSSHRLPPSASTNHLAFV